MEIWNNLTEKQRSLIEQHLALVMEYNEKINLTRIDDVEKGMLLHVEDSLSGLPEVQSAQDGCYLDLGTGGGYPGIPVAIATGRATLLVDARQKKIRVLDEIIASLGLTEQITTYAGRAETLAKQKAGQFAVITARAVSKLSVLMELASPLLMKGGSLVCYKAQLSNEELADAERVGKLVGMGMISDRSFVLSDNETQRRIVCYKKIGKPKVKLPRQEGFAQTKPL